MEKVIGEILSVISSSVEILELFYDFGWFYEDKLGGFTEEVNEILKKSRLMPDKRRDPVLRGLKRNLEDAKDYIRAATLTLAVDKQNVLTL